MSGRPRNEPCTAFGRALSKIILDMSMTYKDFAMRCGLPQGSISHWCCKAPGTKRKYQYPNAEALCKLRHVLGDVTFLRLLDAIGDTQDNVAD